MRIAVLDIHRLSSIKLPLRRDSVQEGMRVTALVPTHHLPEESMAWVTEARNIFDEVIVLIDQQHVTPGTLARAEKVATKVVRNNCGLWRDPNRFSLLSGSESDWVFILEYDEQLSSEWQQK